ncbi:MAG TPA: glycine--tRNA ligase subunit beta [Gallionella sp.]|nr:glycine--tRNA ligase subunit beta [Gallionella sp.]
MTTNKNLLVELLVEELPPKSLKKLGESFAQGLVKNLERDNMLESNYAVNAYASPRRLAALVTSVRDKAPTKQERIKLMPASVGYDSAGKPTAALKKRLEKEGNLQNALGDSLDTVSEGGKDYIYLNQKKIGETLQLHLSFSLLEVLQSLPIPKLMTYQLSDGWNTVNFVRPAHGLVVLHGADIVPTSVLGLNARRETEGHRFEAKAAKVRLKEADSYESQLEREGAVIPSFEKRRDEILKQITAVAASEKLTPVGDDDLLDEVTALVERPNVLVGKFEREFLEVPQECLILTMKANQKYFPLLDANGKLTNKFLIVSNIRPADPSLVIGGNERVVRPRLADAKFFFDQDRKKSLVGRVAGLDKVVYHNKLGTQGERSKKVEMIAVSIAASIGSKELEAQAGLAAKLAKADLLTDMVGEFPELQGIMGRYYAQHDGLSDDIAFAIEDHYKPRFAGDELPRNMVGICIALADKLETLAGMFGIGQVPTGDKDPFALRRHALGVIRILMERDLPLHLDQLLFVACGVRGFGEDVAEQVANFMFERLAHNLREQGYSAQEVDAVVGLRPQRLGDIPKRLVAVRVFAALPESAALAAVNKRVGNILKKEGITTKMDAVNSKLLQESAELALHQALNQIVPKADTAFSAGDYTGSLQSLAALRIPVDAFFDNVMVNVEDAALRTNRLALLSQLHQAMNRVADISKLAT